MSNKQYVVSIPASWLCAREMENCDVDATHTHYCEQCQLQLDANLGIDADVKIAGYALDVRFDGHEVDGDLYEWIEAVLMPIPPIYYTTEALHAK